MLSVLPFVSAETHTTNTEFAGGVNDADVISTLFAGVPVNLIGLDASIAIAIAHHTSIPIIATRKVSTGLVPVAAVVTRTLMSVSTGSGVKGFAKAVNSKVLAGPATT